MLDSASTPPNFSDPRVIKTIRRALKWCDLKLSDSRPREIFATDITSAFGPNSAGRVGAYLRKKLLVVVNNYRASNKSQGVVGYAREYVLNRKSYDELAQIVGHEDGTYEDVFPDHHEELKTLEFEYATKADRYWHPLQNISREAKAGFWKVQGLPFNYDIAACAPSILLQLARRKDMSDLLAEPVVDYLAHRQEFRAHVASITGLSLMESKRLINSLFNGASLALTPFCKAYEEYGGDVIKKLRADKKIRRLRVCIRIMWKFIRQGEWQEVTQHGMTVHLRPNLKVRKAKDKWAIYFKNERTVMDAIIEYLKDKGVKHFTEHDGFRTDIPINISELQARVKNRANFEVIIEVENE